MNERSDFGSSLNLDVFKFKDGCIENKNISIATEIPFTIRINDVEIATLLCSPSDLKELTYGFLFTSGYINSADEILSYSLDTVRWIADCTMDVLPNTALLGKRLITSGCGRGVMYASVMEIALRRPIDNPLKISVDSIITMAKWLQHCSNLYRITGAVHTAGISKNGAEPSLFFDDVGRHNAVDKVIGKTILDNINRRECILISSGRTSSEILHKAKISNISIMISRGAPTHQTVLKAREMGITVIGFARNGNFTIYSNEYRLKEIHHLSNEEHI